jgi:peptide/nickel transport system substrate-binding protein
MPTEGTRRRFLFQTLGVIGGALVTGDLLPLLAEAAKRKQVLRVAVDRDFETLRPDFSAGYTNSMLKRLIYTTPVLWGTKPRPDGSLTYDPGTIEGRLVIAHKVSEDRQTIEFTLRPHAKFANGDPIDAQALKDSYAMHITNRGSGASQLKVCGLPSVDRIEVIDDMRLRLSLDRPVAWGVSGHSLHSGGSVVHAKEILKHATPDDPTGLKWLETKTVESGPFMIDNWEKGTMMSLVPNPHSFEPPKLERIILQIVPDPSTRRIVLERGDTDFAMQIATKDIPDLRKASGVKVTSYPSARGWWLGMTWRKEPFNDPHFRRAIAWAIPYDTLLQVVTRGLAQRLRSCVSMNISGYMEEFWPYETNLEKAREELAQAQVRDGFSVTVPVSAGDAFDEESIVLIKESLAQLGIKLTLQKMSIGQKRTLLVKKQVDMAIYDFRPFVPDVGYYIYWNWLPDSLNNYWGYGNPEAQELGSEVITMAVESPERHAKLRRFQEIINGEVGTIPLFSEFDNAVMRDYLQGYVSYPDGIAMLSKLSAE